MKFHRGVKFHHGGNVRHSGMRKKRSRAQERAAVHRLRKGYVIIRKAVLPRHGPCKSRANLLFPLSQ